MDIKMEAIGYIKSGVTSKKDLPRQSVLEEGKKASIEMLAEYAEGLEGIEVNSHIVVLFYFHKSKEAPIKLIPRGGDEMRGVFATRSPNRPNGIGFTIVKVLDVEGSSLEFEGVDMLDGTPVLDIKPYSPGLNPK